MKMGVSFFFCMLFILIFANFVYAGSSCFPAGTKVLMSNGIQENIENVKLGDMVLSYDESNGLNLPSKVLSIESPIRDNLCNITFHSGSFLLMTDEHPIYTTEGWKSINPLNTLQENSKLKLRGVLQVGDKVLDSFGEYFEIEEITCKSMIIQTYNLKEIANYHTYYANNLLVHNKGGGCSALNGVCGSTLNACSLGTLADAVDTYENYVWECTGDCGGATAICNLPILQFNCFADFDNDLYRNSTNISIPITSACPADYYNDSHFSSLTLPIDCNDSNNKVFQNISSLGIDSDGDGFVQNISLCKTTCVGNSFNNSNGVTQYSDGLINYSNCSLQQDCYDYNKSLNVICGYVKDAVWLDLVGNIVDTANVGDIVNLQINGSVNFVTTGVNYTIFYPVGSSSWSPFFSWISGASPFSFISTKNYWKATSLGNNIFFKAIVTDMYGTYSNISQYINVTSNNNDFTPVARIDSPSNGSVFLVNSVISFKQSSYDLDDILNLVWDFANGTGSEITISNYTFLEKNLVNPNFGNINKSYSVAGIYDVTLTANERGRSLSSSNYTRVVILQEGISVVPIISSPEKGKSVGTDIVSFDASQTYVVNCSTCFNGCSGNRNNGFYTQDGKLNCTYLHAPGTYVGQNLPSNYNLTFKWTLDDGRVIEDKWKSSTYYQIVRFVYKYVDAGEHIANLEVTYD